MPVANAEERKWYMIKRVWNVGGMIPTGKTEIFGGKHITVPRFMPQVPHRLALDWKGISALKFLQPTAWVKPDVLPFISLWMFLFRSKKYNTGSELEYVNRAYVILVFM